MKHYLIAERYAKALRNVLEDEALDGAGEMLAGAAELYSESEALRNVLNNPAIDLDMRRKILREVLSAGETDEAVINLADALLRRGRIALLPDVTVVYDTLADARLGRVRATVFTAAEPTQEQEERLLQALKKWSGKEVRVTRETDPDILGGVIARIGDAVIDGSVRTRIEKLREYTLAYDIRAQNNA